MFYFELTFTVKSLRLIHPGKCTNFSDTGVNISVVCHSLWFFFFFLSLACLYCEIKIELTKN